MPPGGTQLCVFKSLKDCIATRFYSDLHRNTVLRNKSYKNQMLFFVVLCSIMPKLQPLADLNKVRNLLGAAKGAVGKEDFKQKYAEIEMMKTLPIQFLHHVMVSHGIDEIYCIGCVKDALDNVDVYGRRNDVRFSDC